MVMPYPHTAAFFLESVPAEASYPAAVQVRLLFQGQPTST